VECEDKQRDGLISPSNFSRGGGVDRGTQNRQGVTNEQERVKIYAGTEILLFFNLCNESLHLLPDLGNIVYSWHDGLG
jgi:hypothetical protein